jgi:glycerol-3-phosphate dehydrogenase
MAQATKAMKVVVFGSGSFGTALAYKLGQNKHNVTIIARAATSAQAIVQNRRSANYLTDAKYTLPDNVTATTSFEDALKGVDYIVHTGVRGKFSCLH